MFRILCRVNPAPGALHTSYPKPWAFQRSEVKLFYGVPGWGPLVLAASWRVVSKFTGYHSPEIDRRWICPIAYYDPCIPHIARILSTSGGLSLGGLPSSSFASGIFLQAYPLVFKTRDNPPDSNPPPQPLVIKTSRHSRYQPEGGEGLSFG